MSTALLAMMSLAVMVLLLLVLIGFVAHLSRILARTGTNLRGAVALAAGIRHDCESIVGNVLALNRNLEAAATGLVAVAGAATKRAAAARSAASHRRPVTAPPDRQPDAPSRPAGGAHVGVRPGQQVPPVQPTIPQIRELRAPGHASPAAVTPSPATAVRRDFRVRDDAQSA